MEQRVDFIDMQDEFMFSNENFENENIEQLENDLKDIERNLNKNLKQTMEIFEAKEQNDQALKEQLEIINEYQSPREKRDFIAQSIENVNANENIKEVLEILDAQDKNQKEIETLMKTQENELKELNDKISYQNKDESEKSQNLSANETQKGDTHNEIDENFEKMRLEMEKRHEVELQKLKDRSDELENNLNKSIANLTNADDIATILKTLREIDQSLSLVIKQTKEQCALNEKQRNEKLEFALQSDKTKEVVKEFVKELHDKKKTAQKGLNELEIEKEHYVKLDRLNRDFSEIPNEKNLKNLENFIKEINEKTPNFKNNYPKIYQNSKQILEKSKEIQKER